MNILEAGKYSIFMVTFLSMFMSKPISVWHKGTKKKERMQVYKKQEWIMLAYVSVQVYMEANIQFLK